MCFGIVNHAKLCVFYWVLMCLKVVIEDQIEDTKFAQEKFKKSAFSTLFQHVPQYQLDTTSIPLDRSLKPTASSTQSWHLDLSSFMDQQKSAMWKNP